MDTNQQPEKTPASANWILWLLVAAYWFWPVDAVPGVPLDDIAVVVAAATYRKELAATIHTFLQQKIGGG